MVWQRLDGRQPDQLRTLNFYPHFTRFAPGSVLAQCGENQVLYVHVCHLDVMMIEKCLHARWQVFQSANHKTHSANQK